MTNCKLSQKKIFGPQLSEEEVLDMIQAAPGLYSRYTSLSEQLKDEFLGFCMGTRGLNLTYDPMFKAVFDPQQFPSRLGEFLSLCLGEPVQILKALPTESSRLTEESSLLVIDLLVQLETGALANVEIQRIGYMFPGQRCACYSSDLVMRQYSQVRDQCRKDKRIFSYQQIQKVYTIVLFQRSPKEFHKFPGTYLHRARQKFDTGLEMDLVQEYLMIPLDIFLKSQQNISSKLEAWLTLIASDDMKRIREVLQAYPEFGEIYYQVFQFRRNIEELMDMYSEALKILDSNTVKYMVEQQQEELERKERELQSKDQELRSKDQQLDSARKELNEKEAEIQRLRALLSEKN